MTPSNPSPVFKPQGAQGAQGDSSAFAPAPAGSADLQRLIQGRRHDPPTPAQMWVATLHSRTESAGALVVALQDGGWVEASTAASCVLTPQAGDLVQLLLCNQRCWVLHVLERGDPFAPHTLHLGRGEVRIQASALHLQADTTLRLQAQDLHTQADSLQESAQRKHSEIRGWSTAHAAFMDLHAERQLNLFGSVTTVLADALVKVDGAQIHMG